MPCGFALMPMTEPSHQSLTQTIGHAAELTFPSALAPHMRSGKARLTQLGVG